MTKPNELHKLRGTVMKFVSMLGDGGLRRSAVDMAPFRNPARPDFIVWWALENFGGTGGVPLEALKVEASKAGFTWDDSMRETFNVRLSAYGMQVTDDTWTPPNYSTPTRDRLLSGSETKKRVSRLVGKFWD